MKSYTSMNPGTEQTEEVRLQREEFTTAIERISREKGKLIAAVLLSLSIFSYLRFVVIFCTGLLPIINLFDELMWTTPGAVSIITNVICLRYLRDVTVENFNKVLPLVKDDEKIVIKRQLKKVFVHRKYVILLLVVCFVVGFPLQFYNLIIRPIDIVKLRFEYSYMGTLSLHLIWGVFLTVVWLFFNSMLLYSCLGTAIILSKVERKLKPLSIAQIDQGHIKPLGSEIMTIVSCFILGTGINLLTLVVAPLEWWSLAQILIFVVAILILFFAPLYGLHQEMKRMKEEALRVVKKNWWDSWNKSDARKIRLIRLQELKISKIATWPFSGKMLLELIGYIFIPLITWLLAYLLT